jgi:hypothetical protein
MIRVKVGSKLHEPLGGWVKMSLPSTNCFCTLTHPYPVTHPPNGSCFFEPNFSSYHFSFLVHSTHTYLPMKMEQSVPKRWHINSRSRIITQKKAYNIQNNLKSRTGRYWKRKIWITLTRNIRLQKKHNVYFRSDPFVALHW